MLLTRVSSEKWKLKSIVVSSFLIHEVDEPYRPLCLTADYSLSYKYSSFKYWKLQDLCFFVHLLCTFVFFLLFHSLSPHWCAIDLSIAFRISPWLTPSGDPQSPFSGTTATSIFFKKRYFYFLCCCFFVFFRNEWMCILKKKKNSCHFKQENKA